MNVFRCNNCLLTNGVRFTHLRDSSFNVSIGRHIFLANLCQEMSEKSLPFIFVIFCHVMSALWKLAMPLNFAGPFIVLCSRQNNFSDFSVATLQQNSSHFAAFASVANVLN